MSRESQRPDDFADLVAMTNKSDDMSPVEFDAGRTKITTRGAAARLALTSVLKDALRHAEELPDQQDKRKVA